MRWIIVSLVLMTAGSHSTARAAPLLRTIASHITMVASEQVNYRLQCPRGYIPTTYSLTPLYAFDLNTEVTRDFIDTNRTAVNRASLSSTAALDGGGYAISLLNEEHHEHEFEVKITCLAAAATTDNSLLLVSSSTAVVRQAIGTITSFCPPESPVALAGFSNADGRVLLSDVSSAPIWGASANPVLLGEMRDGEAGPPSGWQIKVFNGNFAATIEAIGFVVCGKAPTLQAYVYSVPVPEQAFGYRPPFTLFAPVPDGWTAVGWAFEGGQYGRYSSLDLWMQDGIVIDTLLWYPDSKNYDSTGAEVRAFMVKGVGSAPVGTPARAVAAVLVVPQASAPTTTVSVIEFYNAGLDHYFITAIPDEIAKLDNGTFTGWARTGENFTAYGIGSTGRAGRRPVCRAYGRPEAGLNTHFYSASPEECVATLANRLAWGLEASEVFGMDLPDPASGACPAGGVPVYRVWNQRTDSNHRYTTRRAICDQMVAKGYVAEGYGPDVVTLCALP